MDFKKKAEDIFEKFDIPDDGVGIIAFEQALKEAYNQGIDNSINKSFDHDGKFHLKYCCRCMDRYEEIRGLKL